MFAKQQQQQNLDEERKYFRDRKKFEPKVRKKKKKKTAMLCRTFEKMTPVVDFKVVLLVVQAKGSSNNKKTYMTPTVGNGYFSGVPHCSTKQKEQISAVVHKEQEGTPPPPAPPPLQPPLGDVLLLQITIFGLPT